MYDCKTPAAERLNRDEYRDRVAGCWLGKNIGGTFGAPFEGDREMNRATFYVQDLHGNPTPNDDLDLQLVWLTAIEKYGAAGIDERKLGEFWLTSLTGLWNEYGVCKHNLRNGFIPPLSGACNNDRWKWSNGAWIRSEIWSCLYPGSPDEAAMAAICDACCDHSGEGIYAEMFTAAMEAAAFVISDLGTLIEIGLAKIPEGCRVARAVRLARDCAEKNLPLEKARELLVQDSADLGFFQAPANLGFVVLGLLYGEGDFEKALISAVNCGDDADCTGGTVGAIMGILLGASGIPEKWKAPIGDAIRTTAILNLNPRTLYTPLPETVTELTRRTVLAAEHTAFNNRSLPQFTPGKTFFPPESAALLTDGRKVRARLAQRSEYEWNCELSCALFSVEYVDGPWLVPGTPCRLKLKISNYCREDGSASIRLEPPASWPVEPGRELSLLIFQNGTSGISVSFVPEEIDTTFYGLSAEIRFADRFIAYPVRIPFQRKECCRTDTPAPCFQKFFDARDRVLSGLE